MIVWQIFGGVHLLHPMQRCPIELVGPFDRTLPEQTCVLPHSSRFREAEIQFPKPRPFDLLSALRQSATAIETTTLLTPTRRFRDPWATQK